MTHSQLHLPDSELEIIRILWQKGTATTTEIREALNAERKEPLAHSTVVTLVQRLENRKYVEKTGAQKGKSFVYRAVLQPENAQKYLIQKYFTRFFGNQTVPVISQLLESSDLSRNDIEEIRNLLKEHEKRVGNEA